jgi:D-alanine-D-alanine ligase
MKRKLNVLLLFGGQSAEHEVSIMSARNVAGAIDGITLTMWKGF